MQIFLLFTYTKKAFSDQTLGKMLRPASCSEVRQRGRRMQSKPSPPLHRFLQSACTLWQKTFKNGPICMYIVHCGKKTVETVKTVQFARTLGKRTVETVEIVQFA